MASKSLEFRCMDFCLPAIGLATCSKRNSPINVDSPKILAQGALFAMYHVAYTSILMEIAYKSIELLCK